MRPAAASAADLGRLSLHPRNTELAGPRKRGPAIARFRKGALLARSCWASTPRKSDVETMLTTFAWSKRPPLDRFFAAHWVTEIDVCLTDKLLASAEHSKLRFEPRSSAKNVIACFALRSILTF